jgi:hypothetical protein
LVWVNPPNRVNYTVIGRVRNVRRYASPKCSTNRDSKRRGTSPISSSNHQGKSDLKKLNIQTRERSVGALEILWNLDFGSWNFPTNCKFRGAGLRV